ncbi:probable UDP-glucosyl transferase 73B6 [Phragmites australis]|uniref:probable UDP-glucosyl transferase 73B6 n=1 Tax=Phragmites australis TaxID=29695 RepID=UPI002D773E5C|nr:probable UDP-glucosyl transferase 73B6 [Phragmites australis]
MLQTERTSAAAARANTPLHLLFVPFLARSHFAPLAAKAAAAACGGYGTTTMTTTAAILTTPHFAALAPPAVPVHVAPFRSPDGHEDFSLLPDEASSAQAFFAAAEAALAPAVSAVLRSHDGAVAVVSDAVLYWVPRVARECGVPHVTFHTIGAFAAATMLAVHLHRPQVFQEPFGVPGGFPHPVRLHRVQVNEEALAHLPLFRAAEAESCAVVFNSFSALEADFAEYYQSQLCGRPKKVFLVGPTRAAVSPRAVGGGVERDPILQWLDGRPAGSVVYVCFGSTCGLGSSQLRELATGLRASGRPFLWVIPKPAEGSTEERASSHGMVVAGRWAPQAEILAHRAVGGFVTHCGWNSVLEAVWADVPLATWPLRAEQFLNEAFLVELLRVGVRVREVAREANLEEVVPADAVARAVGRLMDDGEDEAALGWRARARELGAAARAAVDVGGSSCSDWARLVDELKALYDHKSD